MKNNNKLKEQIKSLEGVEKAYIVLANKYHEENGMVSDISSTFLKEAAEVRKQINQLKSQLKK